MVIKVGPIIIFDGEVKDDFVQRVNIETTAAGGAFIQFNDEDEFGNDTPVTIEITKEDIANLQQLTK